VLRAAAGLGLPGAQQEATSKKKQREKRGVVQVDVD